MDARLNLASNPVGSRFLKYFASADKVVSNSTLPAATRELVKLRASQINLELTEQGTRIADAAGGVTDESSGPQATTSPTDSDDKEQRCDSKREETPVGTDFFSADQHPLMTFRSTGLRAAGDGE